MLGSRVQWPRVLHEQQPPAAPARKGRRRVQISVSVLRHRFHARDCAEWPSFPRKVQIKTPVGVTKGRPSSSRLVFPPLSHRLSPPFFPLFSCARSVKISCAKSLFVATFRPTLETLHTAAFRVVIDLNNRLSDGLHFIFTLAHLCPRFAFFFFFTHFQW